MSWFDHYDVTSDMGLREAINAVLNNNCRTGDGLVCQSNYDEVESWGLRCLKPVDLYIGWSNAGQTFKVDGRVSKREMKALIEIVECLTEYAVLNDSRYNSMVYEETERQLAEIANDYGVDPEVFVDLANDMGIYGESTYEGIYVPITDEQVTELVEQTKRDSQTDHAHYYGGQWHSPEHCARCQEFPQLIGARAS